MVSILRCALFMTIVATNLHTHSDPETTSCCMPGSMKSALDEKDPIKEDTIGLLGLLFDY